MTSLTSCLPPIDDGIPPASGGGGEGGGENNGNQDEGGTGDQGGEGGSEDGSDTGAPAVGIGYNGYVEVEALGGRVYFTGETANTDYYLATSLDVASAATLYLEAVADVDGGYRLYFMKDGVKTYIRCYERTAGEAGKGYDVPLHHPQTDFDERVLPIGAALLAVSAIEWTKGRKASRRAKRGKD